MSPANLVGLILSGLVTVFLVVALVFPENEWRRLLQRERGAPVREPDGVDVQQDRITLC